MNKISYSLATRSYLRHFIYRLHILASILWKVLEKVFIKLLNWLELFLTSDNQFTSNPKHYLVSTLTCIKGDLGRV